MCHAIARSRHRFRSNESCCSASSLSMNVIEDRTRMSHVLTQKLVGTETLLVRSSITCEEQCINVVRKTCNEHASRLLTDVNSCFMRRSYNLICTVCVLFAVSCEIVETASHRRRCDTVTLLLLLPLRQSLNGQRTPCARNRLIVPRCHRCWITSTDANSRASFFCRWKTRTERHEYDKMRFLPTALSAGRPQSTLSSSTHTRKSLGALNFALLRV